MTVSSMGDFHRSLYRRKIDGRFYEFRALEVVNNGIFYYEDKIEVKFKTGHLDKGREKAEFA
jgi:hypothetical protein